MDKFIYAVLLSYLGMILIGMGLGFAMGDLFR